MDKSKRDVVIAGNWKMNKTESESKALIAELLEVVKEPACKVVIAVPFTDIKTAVEMTKDSAIEVAAQNCHFEKSGAYTGEISADMLKEAGVTYVVLGHSERRQYFAETDETVNKRAKAVIAAGLTAIICVGEVLEEREWGVTFEVVGKQTKIALTDISKEELSKVVIAYEPVWAIGTGKTATSEQAEEVCAEIRNVIASLYGAEAAESVPVQYGGSMNAGNAKELLSKKNVDGGLIGGASLKAADFNSIIEAVKQ